ncbi:MAG: M48 family metallopeptidase [Dictyoglomus turgidum]
MFLGIFLIFIIGKVLIHAYLNLRNLKHSLSHKEVPEVLKDIITNEELKKAQEYLKDNTVLGLISQAFDLIFTLIFLFLFYPYIEKIVSSITSSFIMQGLLFFGISGLINLILSLPFEVYDIFVIEQKYGFNTMTPKIFILDIIKSIILSIILGVPILSLLLYIIKTDPNFWWKFALVIVLFEIFVYYIYPILIAPLFNKFTPLEEGDLKNRIIEIVNKAGFKVNNIFVMDASRRTKKQNAYLTGFGKTRRVVLFDTMLSYPQEEILAVLAHELGHHKKKHIPKLLILSIVFYLLYIYLTFFVYKNAPFSKYFGITKEFSILLYSFLFVSSIFYFINPLVNTLSRKFEYEADKFSAEVFGNPFPLINALKRLIKENLSNIYPDPIFRTWYYSHPAPVERIYNLLTFQEKGGTI